MIEENAGKIKWMKIEGRKHLCKICKKRRRFKIYLHYSKNNLIIYKKKKEKICNYNKTICFLSVCFEIYTRIIERKLREIVDTWQVAFRSN